jgi:chromosome segregation ATPase
MVKITHVDLRQNAVEEHKPKLDQTTLEVEALKQQQFRLRQAIAYEQVGLRSALIALEARAVQTQELLRQRVQVNAGLQAERLNRINELTAIENELKQLMADITQLEDEIKTAKLASGKEFERVVDVTAQIHEAVGMHRRLSERYEQLRVQIDKINEGLPSAAASAADASTSTGSVR